MEYSILEYLCGKPESEKNKIREKLQKSQALWALGFFHLFLNFQFFSHFFKGMNKEKYHLYHFESFYVNANFRGRGAN